MDRLEDEINLRLAMHGLRREILTDSEMVALRKEVEFELGGGTLLTGGVLSEITPYRLKP